MTANPLFTIITPVYNRADCIIRCIESVTKQIFDSYEMIVVDDGSTDNTLQEIKSISSKSIRLKLISYPENKGVNYARNRGIEKAQGKYIIFLDSDDILTNESLSTIESHITKYPEYSHYLFRVSDRANDKKLSNEICEYHFKDWLSGKVAGDFAHVIKPSCFNNLMFVEEFRIYESLNWLRVLRQNQKQLYIPSIVIERERDRFDSVTRESMLNNKNSILNNYNYLNQYVNWYREDFYKLKLSGILQTHLKKGFLLGLALGETKRNRELIKLIECSKFKCKLFEIINYRILSSIFYMLIKMKSIFNRLKRSIR
jgi:glycosyltransferase involved in cell wall biosynthesis